MPANNDAFRYELKIPFENTPVFQIRRYVNLHPMLFREVYPLRQVNNIYFDTQEYVLLQHHIDGNQYRKKLRLRWYGQGEESSN